LLLPDALAPYITGFPVCGRHARAFSCLRGEFDVN
jgi:hypothetical protein